MSNFFKGTLTYRKGDATNPRYFGHQFIIHVCNIQGGWGKGFVLALTKRWPQVEKAYRLWFRSGDSGLTKFRLGEIQTVVVSPDLAVINMLAQDGYGVRPDGSIPLQYDALRECLKKVAKEAKSMGSNVVAPKLGYGLSLGSWDIIEKMINEELVEKGINVTIYEFEEPAIKS